MSKTRTSTLFLATILLMGSVSLSSMVFAADDTPLKIKENTNLMLLQPLDDSTDSLAAKPGIQIFFDYFNLSWPWVLGVSAGLAILQAMIGGMEMMSVEMKDDGKNRMMWATAGLLIIALAGTILTTINPIFYK